MSTTLYESIDWPAPYPHIPRNAREMKKGFRHVWGQVVSDIEALEAAEIAARNDVRVRLTVEEQQAIFRIKPHASHLYFMYADSTNLVKIGKTTTPAKRIACLRTMSPVPLKCLAIVRSHDLHEGLLHRALADNREHGEWFRMDDKLRGLIEKARTDGIRSVHEFICAQGVDCEESIV